MSERFKDLVLKTSEHASVPWVRTPLSPSERPRVLSCSIVDFFFIFHIPTHFRQALRLSLVKITK